MFGFRCKVLSALFISLSVFSVFSQVDSHPKDWHHADFEKEGLWGIATQKAYLSFVKADVGLQPVVVAVIDGDLDIHHEDLAQNLITRKQRAPVLADRIEYAAEIIKRGDFRSGYILNGRNFVSTVFLCQLN